MDTAADRSDQSAPPARPPAVGAAALSVVGAGTYLSLATVGISRSYQYDEAVTVGFFVRRPSFVDAVTSQQNFNNHPLLTAVSWVVHRFGGTSEAWLRVASSVS